MAVAEDDVGRSLVDLVLSELDDDECFVTKVEEYSSTHCEKSFMNERYLKLHVNIHSTGFMDLVTPLAAAC